MIPARRDLFELELPATPDAPSIARRELRRWRSEIDGRHMDMELAMSEAITNAVMHAYRDRHEPGAVRVQAYVEDGDLHLCVDDEGIGPAPRTDSPGLGAGLALIRRLADRCRVIGVGPGTSVSMTFALTVD